MIKMCFESRAHEEVAREFSDTVPGSVKSVTSLTYRDSQRRNGHITVFAPC